jgi:cation diffusion facilitator CzcD-associated flavoprotein CzcO
MDGSVLEPERAVDGRTDFDAIVVGAGFSGLRMLLELRRLGISARLLEAGTNVAGTWYWNRYPGARTDSEFSVYTCRFGDDVLDDWNWSSRFPAQPEVERYLQYVTNRLDLRRDIEFGVRVKSAAFDEAANRWRLTADDGRSFSCTYFVSATGVLSAPLAPPVPGVEDFQGKWYRTGMWPKEQVDLRGKRVGIVGTGATAVQVIPIVALEAAHLMVFQRTPNFVIPARNHPLDDAERRAVKANYENVWRKARQHVFAMAFDPAGRMIGDITPEEREVIFERGWETGGFRYLFETFDDLLTSDEANETAAEFVREKIRSIVKDPATAGLLCPKDHPLGSKRPPLGHYYYETYNRDNVSLVDVRSNPIERVTATGLRLEDGTEHPSDVLIFATGFDAATGALTRIDVVGRDGKTIRDLWADGPQTYLGVTVAGFPNLFMICGPQAPFANIPVVIEGVVDFIGRTIQHHRESGGGVVEPTQPAVDAWVKQVDELVGATVIGKGEAAHTWILGANVPGKARKVLFYFGGAGTFYDLCQKEITDGWPGFTFAEPVQAATAA